MEEQQLVSTLCHGDYKADIYSTNLPGEFKVVYRDASGKTVEETSLTGISSYKQREHEIQQRLQEHAQE